MQRSNGDVAAAARGQGETWHVAPGGRRLADDARWHGAGQILDHMGFDLDGAMTDDVDVRLGGGDARHAGVAERRRVGVARYRRLVAPLSRRLKVLNDARAVRVEDAEVELSVGVALRRSLGVPRSSGL
jgi:hypothetical protein